uniref:hypothetical protein n=1 Tax=Candidatus Fimivicinus sp. TaxID=3056640 RepID=UPI003FEECB2C
MPSKTGLQKSLRAYALFLIIGLCITALIWGAVCAQLNTRAISFDEEAARVHLVLGEPDGLHLQTGGIYWLIEQKNVDLVRSLLPGAAALLPVTLHCLWEVGVSGTALVSHAF